MHRAFKSNQSGQAPAWSIPPIFAKGGYIQLDRRVCQKTKQNTDTVKIRYQEPIVLERSAKLNKDPDRGDKGDEGDRVDRSDKGAQRRKGKNSCRRAYG